jgi:hypothetical protein
VNGIYLLGFFKSFINLGKIYKSEKGGRLVQDFKRRSSNGICQRPSGEECARGGEAADVMAHALPERAKLGRKLKYGEV